MIWEFIPYGQEETEKNYGAICNKYCEMVPDNDWIIIRDYDTMWMTWDYLPKIQKYITKYPNTGLFTTYTNRVGNLAQCFKGIISEDRDIKNHVKIAKKLSDIESAKEIKTSISGMVMIFKKSTWKEVGGFKDGILTVDNNFSKKILKSGKKILLLQSLYLFHYYRLIEGIGFKEHLL
jgi:GT2 family glycosyltransferase